jgi:hypothetical protein
VAAEPVNARKLRRDNADMLAFPRIYFYEGDDEANAGFPQAAPDSGAGTREGTGRCHA